jgi:hypothetical protein
MRRTLLGALAALCAVVAAGCTAKGTDSNGDGIADGVYTPNDVSVIAPAATFGTVTGLVIDGNGAPISGASVKASLAAGVQTGSTDANGAFTFTHVPGGANVGLSITKDGYSTAYSSTLVPNSAGNVPANDAIGYAGTFRLFQMQSSLTVQVVGYDGSLVPATGVVQVSPTYGVQGVYSGENEYFVGSTVSHATASNGQIVFTKLPQMSELAKLGTSSTSVGQISIVIDPTDVNNDGVYDYGGATLFLTAQQIIDSPGLLQVVLPDSDQNVPLQIVGSNCNSLVSPSVNNSPTNSLIATTDKVYVAFNQRVLNNSVSSSFSVNVLDDDGTPFPVSVESGASPNVFDFTPVGGSSFQPGHGYTVTVQAIAADSRPQTLTKFTGYCFVQPNNSSPNLVHAYYPSADTSLPVGAQVQLEFDSEFGLETSNGTGGGAVAAYINYDLDNDAKYNSQGEITSAGALSPAGGYVAVPDPTKPNPGGLSRFWIFTYTGSNLNYRSVPTGQKVYVIFGDTKTSGVSPTLEYVNGTVVSPGTPPVASLSASP